MMRNWGNRLVISLCYSVVLVLGWDTLRQELSLNSFLSASLVVYLSSANGIVRDDGPPPRPKVIIVGWKRGRTQNGPHISQNKGRGKGGERTHVKVFHRVGTARSSGVGSDAERIFSSPNCARLSRATLRGITAMNKTEGGSGLCANVTRTCGTIFFAPRRAPSLPPALPNRFPCPPPQGSKAKVSVGIEAIERRGGGNSRPSGIPSNCNSCMARPPRPLPQIPKLMRLKQSAPLHTMNVSPPSLGFSPPHTQEECSSVPTVHSVSAT